VRINSMTSDVQVEPRDDLTLRAGVRYARRDASFSTTRQSIATDTVGAIGSVRYRPWSFLDLFARYENVQIDDPFTVPGDPTLGPGVPERQIALTFTNRGTAGFRAQPRDWIAFSWQLVTDSRENDTFNARSQAFGNSVALTLMPLPDLTLFTAYTRRDADDRANILFAPLYAPSRSVQQGRRTSCSASCAGTSRASAALVARLERRVGEERVRAPANLEPGLAAARCMTWTASTAAPS
jgi:hypothetical protein